MKYGRLFLHSVACAVFASNVYADASSLQVHLPKNPAVIKIINDLKSKYNEKESLSDGITARLQNENKHQIEVLTELKTKLATLHMDEKLNSSYAAKLDQLIEQKRNEKINFSLSGASNPEINFLDLRLIDALNMMKAIQVSVDQTKQILENMQALAVQASSGTYSSTELYNLDLEFQGYKNAIPYVQTVDLLNGEKTISGGNLTIQIGEDTNALSTLVVKIQPFDPAFLGLNGLELTSNSQAQNALEYIEADLNELSQTLADVQTPALYDAGAMLASIPSVLYQDFMLLGSSTNVILQSLNGVYSNEQRATFDTYFTYYKSALTQTQTYVSLDGPKMLGGGNIHIRIGNNPSPETTLDIDLPITDVKKLNLDQYNVRTEAAALDALSAAWKDLHDFAYAPAGNR